LEIISWNFFFFIIIVLSVYYFLSQKAQNVWLLFTSVFFIYTWGWQHLLPILIIASTTFFIGKKLNVVEKKIWLSLGVSLIIVVFIFYRILNSPLTNNFDHVILSDSTDIIRQFIIPLGFSFYALQAISYLMDIYRAKLKAETNIIDFFVYMMFFPKILAGPVERAGNFLPQLKKDRVVDNQKLAEGFTLLMVGLFRKIVIAEVLLSILPENYIHAAIINTHPTLGVLSFPFYTYVESVPYLTRLVGIIAFGIYLYNDFAGYTGIVRGISLFIGINLSPNFQVPYLSYSLSDFWSRWHISLSSWLRDYIYFPMVRYFKKKSNGQSAIIPIIIPLLSTMLISGLWHGMTIPLLIWGLTYGIIMIVEQFSFQKWPVLRPQQHSAVVKGIAGILTFSIVTLAWVPFTASSIGEILAFWRVIFKGSGLNSSPDFSFLILVLVFVSFFLDFFQSRNKDETFILKWPLIARASIMSIAFLALLLASTWTTQNVTNVFIYQGF